MKTRIITALIGLPVFLGLMYKGGYYTKVLVFAMIISGLIELFKIIKINDKAIILSIIIFSGITVFLSEFLSLFNIAILLMFTLFIIFIKKFNEDNKINYMNFVKCTQGLFVYFYVTVTLYHLILLRDFDEGFKYVFFMFIIIWATDSFAYFTGMAFGKNKLAPRISPKKTIEGSIGGSLLALIISLFINYKFNIFTDVSQVVLGIIILLLTVISQLGDLFESSIKRIYNVKDSGKILPGHGGILDRFDSTIFVAPIFYILIKFFIS